MFGHTIMVGVGLPFLMGIETRVLEVFTLTLYHPLTNQFAQSKHCKHCKMGEFVLNFLRETPS